MEFITQYTIYCTPEQTKKALELGAPIMNGHYYHKICIINDNDYATPTAEEMIGWLEEREEISDLHIFKPAIRWTFELYTSNGGGKNNHPLFNTRKEATLAAIDAALEYLERQKK